MRVQPRALMHTNCHQESAKKAQHFQHLSPVQITSWGPWDFNIKLAVQRHTVRAIVLDGGIGKHYVDSILTLWCLELSHPSSYLHNFTLNDTCYGRLDCCMEG